MKRLRIADRTQSPPRDFVLELTCDGDHGAQRAPTAAFPGRGYFAARAAAIAAGWRFSVDGRQFGPCCPEGE